MGIIVMILGILVMRRCAESEDPHGNRSQLFRQYPQARKNFFVLKRDGLIGRDRTGITADEIPYMADAPDKLSILETVKFAKPQILFGCSTVSGLFTDEVLIAGLIRRSTRNLLIGMPTGKASQYNDFSWTCSWH